VKHLRVHLYVLSVLLAAFLSGAYVPIQNWLLQFRYDAVQRDASGNVALVEIDAKSIDYIGAWPWSRQVYALAADKLRQVGANDVFFDIDFSSSSLIAGDEAFAAALQRAGGSYILPIFRQLLSKNHGEGLHVNKPLREFARSSWSALVNIPVDGDGVVRRYFFGGAINGEMIPSAAALLAGTGNLRAGTFLIDYGIRSASIPTLSFADLLKMPANELSFLRNKKIVIGGTALELGDRVNSPSGQILPGPFLQVLATESLLQNRALQFTAPAVSAALIFLLIALMALLWRQSAGRRVGVLVCIALVVEASAELVQLKFPIIVDTALFNTAIAAYLAAVALDEIDFKSLIGKIAERRFERVTLSLGEGLACVDGDGKIDFWNPAAEKIFGYQASDLIGKNLLAVCPSLSDAVGQFSCEGLRSDGGKTIEIDCARKNGALFPLEVCISAWEGARGRHLGLIMRDISQRKRETERIRYLAEYDSLTGIANRNKLKEYLAQRVRDSQQVALMLVGVDRFKELNDIHGHSFGDQILRVIARQLSKLAGKDSFVARGGGDEFAIVLHGGDVREYARGVAEAVKLCMGELENIPFRVTACIGVAIFPFDCDSAEALLGNSDLALSRAKALGREQSVFFDQSFRTELEKRTLLESELVRAVDKREFELFYQPQVDLSDGRLLGAEALIRWRHPEKGILSPAAFLPTLNSSSLAGLVSNWVLETACIQARRWELAGHAIQIGVNLSPLQLESRDLCADVRRVLEKTGLSSDLLELELTEDILLSDTKRAFDTFSALRSLGVRVAFDDFGTGYASLSYLKRFQFDRLKIDQTFVRELKAESDDAAIVSSTVSLSRALGLDVIAEGIESKETVQLLLDMGCRQGQGYFFGKPMPASDFNKTMLKKADLADEPVAAA
jgi:diguanylate cyclase (GGDEF)-like protein/PAS domain S-box-containing protein